MDSKGIFALISIGVVFIVGTIMAVFGDRIIDGWTNLWCRCNGNCTKAVGCNLKRDGQGRMVLPPASNKSWCDCKGKVQGASIFTVVFAIAIGVLYVLYRMFRSKNVNSPTYSPSEM